MTLELVRLLEITTAVIDFVTDGDGVKTAQKINAEAIQAAINTSGLGIGAVVSVTGSGTTELIFTVTLAGTYLASDRYTMALAPSVTDAAGNPVAAGWPTASLVLPRRCTPPRERERCRFY